MPVDALFRRPDVRSAERLLAAQAAHVNAAHATVSSDLVRLFRALGGEWSAVGMLPQNVAVGP